MTLETVRGGADSIEVSDPWTRHRLRLLGLGRPTERLAPQGKVWLATGAEFELVTRYRVAQREARARDRTGRAAALRSEARLRREVQRIRIGLLFAEIKALRRLESGTRSFARRLGLPSCAKPSRARAKR